MKKRIGSFVRVCSPLGALVISCALGSKISAQKILLEHESLVKNSLKKSRAIGSGKHKVKKRGKTKARKMFVLCVTFAMAKINTRIDFQLAIDALGITLLEIIKGVFS